MNPLHQGLLSALASGLLIGLMRERRRNDPDAGPSAAGIRTHALAALAAAVAWELDARVFLGTLAIGGVLVLVSYWRTAQQDVGLTGEYSLVLTFLLGALAMEHAGLAGALAVVTALLLHLRAQLHHLGREVISERELHDGLLLAASAAVVLPLLPRSAVDPWGVLVPSALWELVVLVMAAGVAGQVALRVVGARYGLPVAGFFSGFASSTAATVGYGDRAREEPALLPYAVSAALFANLATVLLLAAVLATANLPLLRASAGPLAAGAAVLVLGGAAGLLRRPDGLGAPPDGRQPRAFKLSHALALAGFVGGVLVVSALMSEWIGARGALAAAMLAGMVELQGAALAVGQLELGGHLAPSAARWGIVLLLASSSAVKSVLAVGSGGRAYGLRVALGLGGMVSAAALTAWLAP